ncbi:ectonucleoside triphosphate diphosphohydrolase 5-like [Daphnia pulex]|uniref:ectonucleoside triphosphate diphosphohydrolase 5-like n=1 Tax=Daphnia pulex TaxID=6669 RepID=UPI001EDF06BD|nr:ectonucleoside triphosphate diphosphohydrolase 5-like [Daphnia pulex]XP_046462500.1 ectonucleoside triphosphate diphosphohydrolase 5-like [Daphnia pulex]XP_046462501.1 ectonucleoside triphosphate diphosphohydrolase 5-like [Daphnia pulex]XP_046462502.1 ectonucleoside triphosphate diphosphohydrolase 5-like [Daphnia pulex]XP_046462503.1 ectonucleoside triphosphate diphosphohydrolase 5-like [Daphnia pulex]XP_046462504.1 ectonucleoside triphosphate diphosphohydrolase 5-like [Daphnia pulex]XP_04
MSMSVRNRNKFTPEKNTTMLIKEKTTSISRAFLVIRMLFFTTVIALSVLIATVMVNNSTGWISPHHSTNFLDKLSLSLGLQEHVYTVVIDAGSTGSRVLAFTFHRSLSDRSVKLDQEFYSHIKPGLSAFADDPKKGADSIKQLLDKAKQVVPSHLWHQTPLVLKATAGLRLLPTEKANLILEEVRLVFEESGFMVTPRSVSIMDGIDEGLFSWFTINFLLDRLHHPEQTVAALDLGGGSTQITFVPKQKSTMEAAPQGFIHQVATLHQKIDVYSFSYLGLGLMAARKQILSAGQDESEVELRSPCINPMVKKGWTYSGVNYVVKGTHDVDVEKIPMSEWQKKGGMPKADFNECLKLSRSLLDTSVHKPAELNEREVLAISYYYDRASDHGMIDSADGGTLTIKELFKMAEQICGVPNPDQAFACLDMTYISALLHHGFGLSTDTKLQLRKKIDGYETSWALGAAFHVLHNGI